MEIREYLRLIRRRLWIPILLPLLAAGAAYEVVNRQPQLYEASVIVTIPSLISETDGALTVYSDNFKEAIGSETILDRVNQDVGTSKAALDKGITVTRLQRSILIKVSYTGIDERTASRVVVNASRYALDGLAKPKVAAAQAEVKLAQLQYDRARSAMYSFYRTTGLVIPVEIYTTKLAEMSQLERAYQEALQDRASAAPQEPQAEISTPPSTTPSGELLPGQELRQQPADPRLADRRASRRKAALLQAKITRVNQELADLRPKVLRYRELDAGVTGSMSLLTAAQKDLLDASSLASISSSRLTLDKAVVTPVSRPHTIARGVAVAGGLAFVLALGLLAILELLWPSNGPGRHAEVRG
jgi:hypothetical protein